MSRIYDFIDRLAGFKSIWFDLDGTLVDSGLFYSGAFEDMAAFLEECGLKEESRIFTDYAMGLQRAKGSDYPFLIDDIMGYLGVPVEIKPELLKTYRAHNCRYLVLDDTVCFVLNHLKSKGNFVGVVTNGRYELQMRKIRKLGLHRIMDRVVILDPQKGMTLKPAVQSFLSQIDRTCLQGAVMVGDRFDIDGRFADALGMAFVCVGFHGD